MKRNKATTISVKGDLRRLENLDAAKFLLILGVVMIHCNLNSDLTIAPGISAASKVMNFLSGHLFQSCVATFFILSGFLMFRNVGAFSPSVYFRKISNRFHSIIIPYILWNLIAVAIFLFKVYFMDYQGYGVVNGGDLDFVKFLIGFVDLQNGYPYDFSLWFLRNLIVFSLLSPIAWLIGRSSYLTVILLGVALCTEIDLHGALYFVIGVWIGLRNDEYQRLNTITTGIVGILLWIACNYIVSYYTVSENLQSLLITTGNLSAFPTFLLLARGLCLLRSEKLKTLFGATFFIYAFHSLFVTLIRHGMIRICGVDDSLHVMMAYFMSFVVLTIISLCAWAVCRTFFPHITAMLTGNR